MTDQWKLDDAFFDIIHEAQLLDPEATLEGREPLRRALDCYLAVRLHSSRPCAACGGYGTTRDESCRRCEGSGWVPK